MMIPWWKDDNVYDGNSDDVGDGDDVGNGYGNGDDVGDDVGDGYGDGDGDSPLNIAHMLPLGQTCQSPMNFSFVQCRCSSVLSHRCASGLLKILAQGQHVCGQIGMGNVCGVDTGQGRKSGVEKGGESGTSWNLSQGKLISTKAPAKVKLVRGIFPSNSINWKCTAKPFFAWRAS